MRIVKFFVRLFSASRHLKTFTVGQLIDCAVEESNEETAQSLEAAKNLLIDRGCNLNSTHYIDYDFDEWVDHIAKLSTSEQENDDARHEEINVMAAHIRKNFLTGV